MMLFGDAYDPDVMKPIARSDVVVPFPQLYRPPEVGEPLLVAAEVAVRLPTALHVGDATPAAVIFQLAGRLAVAAVVIPLKFSVTAVPKPEIEICPKE